MLAEQSQSLLHNFDPDIDHPKHLEHHLRSDSHLPLLFVLVSGLTAPAAMLRSTKGEWCPAPPARPETIIHVLLQCRQYAQARDRFIDGLGHKPPDDEILEICLGRTVDRTRKGRRQTRDECIWTESSGH